MAPVHETDIASERWSKAEWSHYELWEKLELKLRRRKLIWISATVAVFLALSSVPIILDRAPKWTAMSISRRLAQVINGMKSEASLKHQAHRIRFAADGSLGYEIERVSSCSATQAEAGAKGMAMAKGSEVVRLGSLDPGGNREPFVLLSPEQAPAFQIPGIVSSFCYDPYAGAVTDGSALVGFGILSAKDLTERRPDRLSVLLIQGASAELSFD
jgi:hypothetical protein